MGVANSFTGQVLNLRLAEAGVTRSRFPATSFSVASVATPEIEAHNRPIGLLEDRSLNKLGYF